MWPAPSVRGSCAGSAPSRAAGRLPSSEPQTRCLSITEGSTRRSVATGKLFEYLAARRPVLVLGEGTAAADIVRSAARRDRDLGDGSRCDRQLARAASSAAIRCRRRDPAAVERYYLPVRSRPRSPSLVDDVVASAATAITTVRPTQVRPCHCAMSDITVVIACFNYGRFLAEAVGSALDQAGATPRDRRRRRLHRPGTLEAPDALPPEVEVVRQANAGASAARNAGIARATAVAILRRRRPPRLPGRSPPCDAPLDIDPGRLAYGRCASSAPGQA